MTSARRARRGWSVFGACQPVTRNRNQVSNPLSTRLLRPGLPAARPAREYLFGSGTPLGRTRDWRENAARTTRPEAFTKGPEARTHWCSACTMGGICVACVACVEVIDLQDIFRFSLALRCVATCVAGQRPLARFALHTIRLRCFCVAFALPRTGVIPRFLSACNANNANS